MSEQQDKQQTADIEQVSDELTRGLEVCHSLIADYRSKLATPLDGAGTLSAANDDETVEDNQSDRA